MHIICQLKILFYFAVLPLHSGFILETKIQFLLTIECDNIVSENCCQYWMHEWRFDSRDNSQFIIPITVQLVPDGHIIQAPEKIDGKQERMLLQVFNP